MNIEELEKLRHRALIATLLNIFIPIAIIVVAFKYNLMFLLLVDLIMTMSIYEISDKLCTEFKTAYKRYYMNKVLPEVFEDLKYDEENGLQAAPVVKADVLEIGDLYRSSHLVTGKYQDTYIEASNISMKNIGGDDRISYFYHIFKGKWIIVKFPKKFKSAIQVREKDYIHTTVVDYGPDKISRSITMDNKNFNKKFITYAVNSFEAFSLLDKKTMESILKLEKAIKGNIVLCFIDDTLHIGINTTKYDLKHSVFEPIDDVQEIRKIKSKLHILMSFIEDIQNDNKLYKREEI